MGEEDTSVKSATGNSAAAAGNEAGSGDNQPASSAKMEKKERPKQFGILKPEEEELIKCSEEGLIEQARVLLKNSKKRKFKVDCLDDSGTTPLGHACYKGNVEMAEVLIAAGADVNNNMQVQGYTPLMFAALAGKTEAVRLLLRRGARTSALNSINRTAAQMAGFVGQSQIAIIISNFFTLDDLLYYTVPQGLDKEPKLPPQLAPALHKFLMVTNLHPVKLIGQLRDNQPLLDEAPKVMRTLEAICQKEMRTREVNEVMAMKVHYLTCIIQHVCRLLKEGQSFDDILKLFVRGRNAANFPEYLEKFLRESIRSFPFHQTPLHSTMVHAIAKANLGGAGGSLSILEQSINGQHLGKDGPPCETCSDAEAAKKCGACRMVAYCHEACQKLHWPVHRRECAELARQCQLMREKNAQREKKEEAEKMKKKNEIKLEIMEETQPEPVMEEEDEEDGDGVEEEQPVDVDDIHVGVSDTKPLLSE